MFDQDMINEYLAFLNSKAFPCVGAKAALARKQIKCMVADHMGCPKDDGIILQFLYDFVDTYRSSTRSFHSAAVIFKGPEFNNDSEFDRLLWQRLQALASLDKEKYSYDKRVDCDPSSPRFSFSLKEEAFFIIGLNASSSRLARRFKYPTLVFNPHAEFEKLRHAGRYQQMKEIVRKREVIYSGTVNPTLTDFGEVSEVYQYSGVQHDNQWQCPLGIEHQTKAGEK